MPIAHQVRISWVGWSTQQLSAIFLPSKLIRQWEPCFSLRCTRSRFTGSDSAAGLVHWWLVGILDTIWWTRHGQGWEAVHCPPPPGPSGLPSPHLRQSGDALSNHFPHILSKHKKLISPFPLLWVLPTRFMINCWWTKCSWYYVKQSSFDNKPSLRGGQPHPRTERSTVIGRILGMWRMGAPHWPRTPRGVEPVRETCIYAHQNIFGQPWAHGVEQHLFHKKRWFMGSHFFH